MAFPTTSVFDAGTRADATNLNGGTFTYAKAFNFGSGTDTLGILSNKIQPRNSLYGESVEATVHAADQEVYCDLTDLPSASDADWGCSCRYSGTGASATGYRLTVSKAGVWTLNRVTGGATAAAVGATASQVMAAGDGYGLEVSGTGATVTILLKYRTGGVWSTLATRTDTNAARITGTGKIGYYLYQSGGTPGNLDNLGGGAIVASGSPVNTVAPAITGTLATGSVQTCSTGTWTGDATITFGYQWKAAGVNISGETASTYTLVEGDEGVAITCVVTGTNGVGNSSATSNTITPPTEPANSVAPAITGVAETAETLTCSQGTWSPTGDSYTRQWKRDGSNIVGATSSTYLLDVADEGTAIKCTVTATNGAGSTAQDSNTVNPTAPSGGDPEPTAFLKWGGVLVPSVVRTKFGGVLYPAL